MLTSALVILVVAYHGLRGVFYDGLQPVCHHGLRVVFYDGLQPVCGDGLEPQQLRFCNSMRRKRPDGPGVGRGRVESECEVFG